MDQEIIPTENEEILKDVLGSIEDNQWCQKNFYELPADEALKYGWNEFSRKVKHSTRYVFFQVRDESEDRRGHEEIPPYAMLDVLGNVISEVNLIKDIKKGTTIFRVRIHEPSETFTTSKDLGPPEIAKYSNRMSPAGISMFYGAFAEKTAIDETFEKGHKKTKVATVATFEATRDMKVLDLTALPAVPSLFDQSKRSIRAGIIFLYSFVKDVSKPISKDGIEHIEYVPTQIFTEYFRHIFVDEHKNKINGILYRSSKHNGGVSSVLFLDNKNCADSATNVGADISLILIKTERISLNKINNQNNR